MSIVLLLFKGHPGVGKSTLAREVCKQLGWPLVDKDDARDCLQHLPAHVLQTFDANKLSYDIMFSYCETQLQLGLSTVLDCPFARVSLYERAQGLASKYNAVIAVVDCVAGDAAVWKQQLEARAAQQHVAQDHKPQSWEELQQLLQRYGDSCKWTADGSCMLKHHLVIDTTGSDVKQQVQQVLGFLQPLQAARNGSAAAADSNEAASLAAA